MKIPKYINKNNRKYIFEKIYPNYIMYRDMLLGTKECFNRQELGLIKEIIKPSRDLQKIHKR